MEEKRKLGEKGERKRRKVVRRGVRERESEWERRPWVFESRRHEGKEGRRGGRKKEKEGERKEEKEGGRKKEKKGGRERRKKEKEGGKKGRGWVVSDRVLTQLTQTPGCC